MDVGERLKAIRKLKGISQRELAKRVGVTNSTISMIEKNGVSPSVSSLKKVLSGIPISIGDFFTLDLENIQPDLAVFSAESMPEVGTAGWSRKLVGAGIIQRLADFTRERFAPGADSGSEMLQAGGEKTGVIVSGCIELTVGFQVYELNEGDGFCFDSSRPHRFRNTGDTECELCVVNVPLPPKSHQPGIS
ncbi:helix-turn-helix domain-containing protein [Aliamphritea ceti]|uniref:helix-turn-helix domain-containing protein n=1 Tax=Aliamphritea ceti TaxID=1524258 RepID=UPI0021C3AC88|nr:helix-turn-helix domain-containing protein [Aliamphritea ceti]